MKKFAELLTQYIANSGLKQTHLAFTAGISYNYLQRLLSGSRHPSDQVVYKLAEALHLSTEQTGQLVAAAGYVPPLALLQTPARQEHEQNIFPVPSMETNEAMRMAQQMYKVAQEVPETLQHSFLEEMKHLLGYARYKYVLSGNANVLDLTASPSSQVGADGTGEMAQQKQPSLDVIAQIVGALYHEPEGTLRSAEEVSHPSQAVEEMLSALDQLIGNLLTGEVSAGDYQSDVIGQLFTILQQTTPWEIRHRIAKALPHLFQFDLHQAERLMETLRLDLDEVHGADIRRRVIEALPGFFQLSPHRFLAVLRFLRPKPGDDIYVALATLEACGDIQTQIKYLLHGGLDASSQKESLPALLDQNQAEISRIQRQVVSAWDDVEKESLQYSMALHDLLCAPDTLLISLREGIQSNEKLLQQVAARYLERVLPSRPVEALELYKTMLHTTEHRNLHRTVAKALPTLLNLLQEASLPARALVRDVICSLTRDSDIHVRRAVADYAMRIFHIDREFLLVLLRLFHQEKDHVVRYRLQPAALRLAQVWLTWYAEAAGLIGTKSSGGMHTHLKRAFWEVK